MKAVLYLLAYVSLLGATVSGASSVSQFGVTWFFEGDPTVGQFVNGDFWVVGPVTLKRVTPDTAFLNNATLHGSMLNPVPNTGHGFDSRVRDNLYDSKKNVALSLPIVLHPGSSLLSCESHLAPVQGDAPQLKTIAILTVLATKPAPGAFRPPYCGTDKTLKWHLCDLDRSRLGRLPLVPQTPALIGVEPRFERPWIEIKTDWTGRYLHPSSNQPAYGREMAHQVAEALLLLQLDVSAEQKQTLLVRILQYGLDIFGAARLGAEWPDQGGHNQGRKMPMLLAGALFRDADILEFSNADKHLIFQEDRQVWYVNENDVGRPLHLTDGRPRDQYIKADIGVAEWGEQHYINPKRDGRNWNSYYRDVAGSCTIGHILTARLMGLETAWGSAPIFDYYDRYWEKENTFTHKGPNGIQPFVKEMWKRYRLTKSHHRRSFESSDSRR